MFNIGTISQGLYNSVKDGVLVCRRLFPMIISVVVFVKILSELNLIEYVALPLGPVMETMGLPVEFGLVWAAAMLVNIYSEHRAYGSHSDCGADDHFRTYHPYCP